MSHTKCLHCGLVNWSGVQVCGRCGASFNGSDAKAPVQESLPPDLPGFTFGQDASTSSLTLKVVMVVAVALAIAAGVWAFYKRSVSSGRASNASAMRKGLPPPTVEERTRDTLLSYLAQPGFAGERLAEQVLGPARLELVQISDREIYFSVPQADQTGETFEAITARFIVDPTRIELAEDDGAGRLRLGKYLLGRSENKHYLFKTAIDNIKFDPKSVLEFHFLSAVYRLDMRELNDFVENKTIFGGRMHHITVAVKQGGFPARNGLALQWEGQTWLIAEGTMPGFRIGVDRVQEAERLKQFQYVQRPRDRDVIFDVATGRQLLFQ